MNKRLSLFNDDSLGKNMLSCHTRQRDRGNALYRARISSLCFPEITKGLKTVGPYNMPVIQANNNIPTIGKTTPFDRIRSKNSLRESLIIFYINDYRFAQRLTHPWDYTECMREYLGIIGPDLSQYINMDYPIRLQNNYWNKAFTAYWQNLGLNVYPNVTWNFPDSYEYSVAGLPIHSVIAINSMGILKSNFSICLWLQGYHYMIEALKPTLILRYGPKINGEDESISFYGSADIVRGSSPLPCQPKIIAHL